MALQVCNSQTRRYENAVQGRACRLHRRWCQRISFTLNPKSQTLNSKTWRGNEIYSRRSRSRYSDSRSVARGVDTARTMLACWADPHHAGAGQQEGFHDVNGVAGHGLEHPSAWSTRLERNETEQATRRRRTEGAALTRFWKTRKNHTKT